MAIRDEYRKERKRIQSYVNKLKRKGYVFEDAILPPIPKRITAGSVRRLSAITPEKIRSKSSVVIPSTGEVVGYTKAVKEGYIQPSKRVAKPGQKRKARAKESEAKQGAKGKKGSAAGVEEKGTQKRPKRARKAAEKPTHKPPERAEVTPNVKTKLLGKTRSKGRQRAKEAPKKGIDESIVKEIEYENWRHRIRVRGYGEGAQYIERFLDNWEKTIGKEATIEAIHKAMESGVELKNYHLYQTDGAMELINELLDFFPTLVNQFDELRDLDDYLWDWEQDL